MLLIAGQTAGPIGLKFFVDTPWVAGGRFRLKNSKILFLFLKLLKTFFFTFFERFFSIFFNGQRRTLQLVRYIAIWKIPSLSGISNC